MKRILRLSLIWFSLFYFSNSFAQKAVPELWGQRVHDEAHALQQATVDQLEKSLKAYEDSTSNQIAILIVQSLDGDVLEEYSLRVAEKWKLGQKEKDNGVLLLIAIDDRKIRIEVGQGLEGVLTDAQSNRIIRNEIAPAFRRNDYDDGVVSGIDSITKTIGGEYTTEASGERDFGDSMLKFVGIIVGILLVLFVAYVYIRQLWPNEKGANGSYGGSSSSRSGSGGSSSLSSFSGGGGSFGGGGSSGSW